jgi:autotransporter-associated beta strand protein
LNSTNGSAFGAGIFLQGNENLVFAPAAGQKTVINDVITDEAGSNGGGVGATGKGSLTLDGPGTLDLTAANSFFGGVTIKRGTLEIGNTAGARANIAFAANGGGTLELDAGVTSLSAQIVAFDSSNSFDFAGFDPTKTHANFVDAFGPALVVTDGVKTDVLSFAVTLDLIGHPFFVAPDGAGGSIVSLRTPGNHAPVGTDKTVTITENGAYTFTLADFGFSDPNDHPPNALTAVEISSLPVLGLTDNGVALSAGEFVLAADIAAGLLVYRPNTFEFGAPYDSFSFQVQDDGGTANGGVDTDPTAHLMTIDVNQVAHQPQFTGGASDAAYFFIGGQPAFLAPNITLADDFDPVLSQATVSVSAGLASGDELTINGLTSGTINNISYNYDSNTGLLTLSGQDSIADYQAALRLVAFSSTDAVPPANGAASRSFSLTATSADPVAPVTSLAAGPTLTLAVDVAYFLANQSALDALPSFTVADSWSNVSAQLDALNHDKAVASIKLTDPVAPDMTITAAQATRDLRALGALSASWPISVTVSDTASALLGLASLPVAKLTALKAAGVSALVATDAAPTLDAAQARALEAAGLTLSVSGQNPPQAVLSDTGAALRSLFDDQSVSGFALLSIGSIVTTTDVVLTAAQTSALFTRGYSVIAAPGHKVTYNFDDGSRSSYTNGAGGALTAARDLAADGSIIDVEYLGITGRAYTSYAVFYAANGKPSEALYSNGMNAAWSYNADGSLHDITYFGVTGQAYTDYDVVYGPNGKPANATYSNGMTKTWTYNADGSVHDIAFAGVTGRPYTSYDVVYNSNGQSADATYSNGMTQTWSYYPDGTLKSDLFQNVTGKTYTELENDYDNGGILAVTRTVGTDGSTTIKGHENGLTFSSSIVNETFNGGGPDEIFSFTAPFGHDTLADFASHIAGADHDTLLLSGVASIGNLTQLLAATMFGKNGASIKVDTNDTINVPGLTETAVLANPQSFQFS